jgi:hypothetical protein
VVNSGFRSDAKSALATYQELGYLVEEDLVPEPVISRLVATALDFPNSKDGTFGPIEMPHRAHPVFLEMMRFPPLVSIVEALVGARASGIGGEFFYMRPGMPGFVKHQDNAYIQAPSDAFVSAWTALCDVDERNGCLVFYPGSHKLGVLPTRVLEHTPVIGQNPGAEALESVMPKDIAPLSMPLKRGTTVFFHGDLVHASCSNITTDRFRYSILATYIRKGEPFRRGRLQNRTEIDLHESNNL